MTILVVDGTPEFKASVRSTLEPRGFLIIDAATPATARETIQRGEVSLLIITVEGMDGAELISWSKEQFPALPLITIAGGAYPIGIQEDGYASLLSPVTSEELLSTIHQLLPS